jgi:hypothetical protein
MDVSAEIHCGKCGSANYSLMGEAQRALILCNDCGAEMGTLGALIEELTAQVTANSAESQRARFNQIEDPRPS